jgi:hypothetical protein
MIELFIKIKDAGRTLSEKEIVGDEYHLSATNPDLLARIKRVYDKFKEEGDTDAPRITVKASLVVQK